MQKKSTSKTETLGARIKKLRRDREWSREQLGEKIDIHWQTIGKYENDAVIPTATVLKKIAEVFGVTSDYLLFGEADNTPINKVQNKDLLRRFEKLDRINPDNIKGLLEVMDVYIQKNTAKEALATEEVA